MTFSATVTAPSSSLRIIVLSTRAFARSYTLPVTVPDPTSYVVRASRAPSPVTVASSRLVFDISDGTPGMFTLSVRRKAASEG